MFAIPFSTPIGTNIPAASLPGGMITAVTIDNPTGSWAWLPSIRQFVPPYTLGWAQLLDNPAASFAVEFAAIGPDGTASIARGDPLLLTLYDFEAMRQRGIVSGIGTGFVPILHKRIITTVGFTNESALAFTGADLGRLIAGIIIDNPSGAWLTLTIGGAVYRIAPYTLRWVKRIDPPVLTLASMTFDATGPAGQVSTRQGDQATITLLDGPPDAPDTSFITGFTPTLATLSGERIVRLSVGLGPVPIVAGVVGKRIRLLSGSVAYDAIGTGFPVTESAIVYYITEGSVGAILYAGRIDHAKTSDIQAFSPGLDLPIFAAVEITAITAWADTMLLVGFRYQVI